MINKFRNIFKKLNKLNSDIVFFYYSKYRDDKYIIQYFPSDFSNIDLDGFYNSSDMTSKSERYMLLKIKLPYYYKMINLYAHLTSIVEYNRGNIGVIYTTVQDNFIINVDIPQDTMEQMLLKCQEDMLNEFEIDEKNKELKILMKNANSLNSDFKKYGKDENEFCRNSSLNDYEYLSNAADAEKERKDLQNDVMGMELQLELSKLDAKHQAQLAQAQSVANQMMGQNMNGSPAGIMPATSTSFVTQIDESMKNELKYLSNLYDVRIISKQEYSDRMNVVVLKYNKKSTVPIPSYSNPPVQSPNPMTNKTELYDKLFKINHMVDDNIMKKIIKESEKMCKKDDI